MGHPSRRVITKPLDPVVHQQEEEYNNEGIISVYCAILGAIVLGKISSFIFQLIWLFVQKKGFILDEKKKKRNKRRGVH